ncbi:serine protease [Thalassobaculum sp. OXR-137]|uniref:S1 family peptidase n=1 Tax=Thalassobaculum sp. OXR-137 TaxID=3100173 RepID=UPI002AC8A8F4|nr:serine protease [Thalassobaculum sp. OXR-137]WPZ34413.1 serine protease [Thalassobaculum sp. OXR-137]
MACNPGLGPVPAERTSEPILLTALRLSTYSGQAHLTNASGFFFQRGDRLYLVTSRHVLRDAVSGHNPSRILIELHTDGDNLAASTGFSIPLYRDGQPLWRDGIDGGGRVDVAAIAIDRDALPETLAYRAFTPEHLVRAGDLVEIGCTLMVVGFPLGFHDTLHHMPVVRRAALASSFGLRFQGQGYFLTDARTHRGTSGAPVVMPVDRLQGERSAALGDVPWLLLGIHSSRLDLGSRDLEQDEALGLNCTWYADILLTLTET